MRHLLVLILLAIGMHLLGAVEKDVKTKVGPIATIAVAEFQNLHPLLEQAWISSAAADLVASALADVARGNSGITVLDRTAIAALDQEQRLSGAGGTALGTVATHIFGGSFIVTDGIIELDLALSANGQAAVWTQRLKGSQQSLVALTRRAAIGALTSFGTGVSLGTSVVGAPAREVPLTALVTFHRGKEAAARGDHAWALADLLRTCKTAPQYGEAWLALGTTLEALGRPAAAMVAWEQAVTVDPDDPGMPATLYRLARAQEKLPHQARRLYQLIINDYPYTTAPPDLMPIIQGRSAPRLAAMASERLAQLVEILPAVAPAFVSGGKDSGAVAHSLGQSAGTGLVQAHLQQLKLFSEASNNNNQRNMMEEPGYRQALLAAAGGWPAMLPVLRLNNGTPTPVPNVSQGVMIAPAAGHAIERLTVTAVPRDGVSSFSFDLSAERADKLNMSGETIAKSKEGHSVTAEISPLHANGFYARGHARHLGGDRAKLADVVLTATLRPSRPGSLWIVTQPPGARILLDGVDRGISPCRIPDLPPGKVKLSADSLLSRSQYGDFIPVQNYFRFRGEAEITVAPTGETRVNWTLNHRPEVLASQWSALSLVAEAPLSAMVLQNAEKQMNDHRGYNPKLLFHEKLGWIASYTEDKDVVIRSSRDGKVWSAPAVLPINTGSEELLEGLAVSPQGQLLVVFGRNAELHAITTQDLVTWTQPNRIAEKYLDYNEHTVYAVWSPQGKWFIIYSRRNLNDQIADSKNGQSWETHEAVTQKTEDWLDQNRVVMENSPDGGLIMTGLGMLGTTNKKQNGLIRYRLNDNYSWALHDKMLIAEFKKNKEFGEGIHHLGADSYFLVNPKGENLVCKAASTPTIMKGPWIRGVDLAIASNGSRTMLLTAWAQSWWIMEMVPNGSMPESELLPQISYEVPFTAERSNTVTSALVTDQSTQPVNNATVESQSVPISIRSDQQSKTVTATEIEEGKSIEPIAKSTSDGSNFFIWVILIIVMIGVGAGLYWWFMRGQRGGAL